MSESEHFVQFCETDEFLEKSVSKFTGAGLMAGGTCIVVATQPHREGIEDRLKADGLAVSIAQARGKYISMDAAATLAQFMVDGSPSPARFNKVIGGLISEATKGSRNVRVFGEMVALLWANGNRSAAIRLEELWNDLATIYAFSLFCAYPMQGFGRGDYSGEFHEICGQHSRIVPAESYSTLTESDERLRAIALLQQKASALEAEVAERKRTEEALRASEARKDEFISMASHELKTPVTSLKGFVHILQNRLKKQADEESLQYVATINKQLNKLTKLINDMLDITRVQQGKLGYQEDFFDLDTLVQEAVENLQAGTPCHQFLLEDCAATQVYGDRDRIGQVVINLLTNAVKYSPAADKVIVHIAKDQDNVIVSVQDFGIGIAENHHQQIFERFYQVTDPEEKTYPGLGIGLYICSEIIKRHQGRIWVESSKGAGSIFSFSLPLAAAN